MFLYCPSVGKETIYKENQIISSQGIKEIIKQPDFYANFLGFKPRKNY